MEQIYRQTYAEINLENLDYNIKTLIQNAKDYKYHIAVVKADSYGHHGYPVVEQMLKSGINYLAVSSLEEALEIRDNNKEVPLLCLGIVMLEHIDLCLKNDIAITISSLDYAEDISKLNIANLKVHFKINTGMNRLGISSPEDLLKAYTTLKAKAIIEGLYTHMYIAHDKDKTNKQVKEFERITQDINLKEIPIIHFGGSDYSLNYPKLPYVNGVRYGIAMYGLADSPIPLKSTFSVYSHVYQINNIDKGTLGYEGEYEINEPTKIAVVPIGYADGILRNNSGRYVYINDKKYPIVGKICMDMLFVKVDDSVKVNDKVAIIKDNDHIREIAKYTHTNNHEILCLISKRVPRVYI